MPFLLLLVLTLACWPDNWPKPFWCAWAGLELNPLAFGLLTWLGVALVIGQAAVLARRTRRQLISNPGGRESILEDYGNARFYHLLGLLAFYGLALYLLGWGWTVQSLGPLDEKGKPQMFPGGELVILAPFLAALISSWACFYDADRALHDTAAPAVRSIPFWSRRAYVAFHARHNMALVLAPVVLLILEKAARRWTELQESLVLQWALLGLLLAMLISLPWWMRLVLALEPLPKGPLRDRLFATARRLNFRCSNILLWNTNGGVANAMVAGVLPYLRYVLLTDRLISELNPNEVEAVFGHEVGHVKHHHMVFYLGFVAISLSTLWVLAATLVPNLDDFLRNNDYWATLPLAAILGTYIFVVFGFLSRRCERQADIFGCRAMSCARLDCSRHDDPAVLVPAGSGLCPTGIRTFMEALEKVGRVNGISRSRPGLLQSWQHSTIARRIDFLQRVLAEPGLEARFQRTVRLVKWGIMLVLMGVLLLLGMMQDGNNFWPLF